MRVLMYRGRSHQFLDQIAQFNSLEIHIFGLMLLDSRIYGRNSPTLKMHLSLPQGPRRHSTGNSAS